MKYLLGFLGLAPATVFAAALSPESNPVALTIFWVTLLFLSGIVGRMLAIRVNQPGVLGELLAGIIVGNILFFFGNHFIVFLREGDTVFSIMQLIMAGSSVSQAMHQVIPNMTTADHFMQVFQQPNAAVLMRVTNILEIFSQYGVMFLLFMVGLESSITQLKHTGKASLLVACIGVVMPIALGILVTLYLMPNLPFGSNLFIAATLCATSVGVTARVLKEMNILKLKESQTILGAAVIDDILGLIILAVVSSLIVTGKIGIGEIGVILLNTALFFLLAFFCSDWLLRGLHYLFKGLVIWEEKLLVSFVFLMGLAWLAISFNLASIIGAFTAGVIIHDGYFRTHRSDPRNHLTIRELLSPLEFLLAPLFFVLIGMQVKLESFYHLNVLGLGFALIVAATLGKLLSGLGAYKKDNRLFVGIGMLPRGEVGLVFASVGKTLGVITDQVFAAVILMILVTTVIAPPWLKYQYHQMQKKRSTHAPHYK